MEKKNYLLINYEYPPIGGGGGNATQKIARFLVRQGINVTVLTSSHAKLPKKQNDNGVEVLRIWSARIRPDRCSILEMVIFLLHALIKAPNIAQKAKTDLSFVFFTLPSGPIGWWLKRKLNIPYIVSLQGGDVPGFMKKELRLYHWLCGSVISRIWESADFVVANSKGLADLARKHNPKTRIDIIPAGAEITTLSENKNIKSNDSLNLLFVGRLVHQKGLDILLEALSKLQKKYNWKLSIVGEGPLRKKLNKSTISLGLQKKIKYLGWVEKNQLPIIYQSADVFILPSRDEGMPNAMLEAMSFSLPVIGSKVSGIEEVISDGRSGILVPPENSNQLMNAIIQVIENYDQNIKMGKNAREHVKKFYSWESVTNSYLSLIDQN